MLHLPICPNKGLITFLAHIKDIPAREPQPLLCNSVLAGQALKRQYCFGLQMLLLVLLLLLFRLALLKLIQPFSFFFSNKPVFKSDAILVRKILGNK